MISLLHVFLFIITIGAVLLNMCICHYFNQQMQALHRNVNKQRYFNILSFVLSTLPGVLLLPFLFGYGDIWLVYSAFGLIVFLSIVSYCDYRIFTHDKKRNLLWNKLTYFDKIIIGWMLIISICVLYFLPSLRNVLLLMCVNLFFIYMLLFGKVRKQNKFSHLSVNKFIRYIEKVICNLFYYTAWLVIGIYILSMSIHIISLYLDPYDTDGCMDTGICKEGFTFDDCGNGKPCIITKENCLKNNNLWLENIRSCDTRHIAD